MQYRPEQIIDLPLEQKQYIVTDFKKGDEVDILYTLSEHGLLTIPLPIKPELRDILRLDTSILHQRMANVGLNTNVTYGEAVVLYYKYLLCSRGTGNSITIRTSQTFVLMRDALECNSTLGLLTFGRDDVTIPEEEYNSHQLEMLIDAAMLKFDTAKRLEAEKSSQSVRGTKWIESYKLKLEEKKRLEAEEKMLAEEAEARREED